MRDPHPLPRPRRPDPCAARLALAALPLVVALGLGGCTRGESRARGAIALPVTVASDSGSQTRLRVPPAATARAWLTGVTRDRLPPAHVGRVPPRDLPAPETPLPGAEAPAPEPADEAGRLARADADLLAPIPRGAAPLAMPEHRCRGPECAVELDVRVDEDGAVSDVVWAGGSEREDLVRAATDCARGMRFYPALLEGRPVAVWCRQRFEFGGR